MAMGRNKRHGVALGVCVAAMVVGSTVVAGDSSSARAPAVGSFAADLACPADPFFPGAQNSGYDVGNYSLRFSYEPSSKRLAGLDLITATATQNLSQFDLDLRGFSISSLKVNGRAATFSRAGSKLVITPNVDVLAGVEFTVRIRYAGRPSLVRDPDDSLEGWFPTADGAFVVGEPQGSPAWYPVNDTPCDKATYDFSVTVPRGLTVMANGVLVSHLAARGKTSWVWRESEAMAPYLATARIGRFRLTRSKLRDGTPVYLAVERRLGTVDVLRKLPAIVDFFSSIYGPYPFDAAGAIVDSSKNAPYPLETQTKPLFPKPPNETELAHELAHQWFGDSVTLTTWSDIWLNEGFATWSEWIWSEHEGNETAEQLFQQFYATTASEDRFWSPPPADLGSVRFLFAPPVYLRGAMTLQALRDKIGDSAFFRVMRDWATQNQFANVRTAQFIALAQRDSGLNLQHFFHVWLYQLGKPTNW
jgi:aminopeptidase N